MAVNYDDERFQRVNNETQQAIDNVTNMYNDMRAQSEQVYQDQIQAAENYGKQQAEIQQANTDFAIEQINQQKEQANKDYIREQKGAYADWQKESNQYGVNAEQIATRGLTNTGYSESSQISMYNTYQNRVSQARDTYARAVQDYDNGITEARLTNNAKLAEIAYKALSTKLELGLNQFQYNNKLLESQLSAINNERDRGYSKWQDVLKQINTENALAEEKRQFNTTINNKYSSGGARTATITSTGNSNGGAATIAAQAAGYDSTGNSPATQQKSDYYFSNGYQPRYIGDQKLQSSGLIVKDVFGGNKAATDFGKQNIWMVGANPKKWDGSVKSIVDSDAQFYVWDGATRNYVDVTNQVKESVTNKINLTWGE